MLKLVAKKTKLLTVKLSPDMLRDFKVVADLRGVSMSAIISMFVARQVRDERERNPEAFIKANELARPVVTAKIKRPKDKGKGKQNRG